jgi:hypothetical protein
MKYFSDNKKIIFLFISYLVLYLISSSYMYERHDPNLLATAYDASRYVGLNSFFDGVVYDQKTAWHLFFTYTLFIRILEDLNIIKYYVEIQYVIFYLSSILFYKFLINFNFSKLSSFLSTIFIICNPFLIFWIHTLNHAGLTISLLMICLYFLSKYDDAKIFRILFFIFIFFSLKNDGKVFFPIFMILFYNFFLRNEKKSTFNFLILLVFFILYFLYLSKFAVGLQDFSASYLQNDIGSYKFISPTISSAVMETYRSCLITELNSLHNHLCAMMDNPLYSIKLYSARLFLLLTWINTNLSLKYNFFAFGMMFFLYLGLIINLIKTKFTRFKFFLISSYLITIVVVLPYLLRGDQKFVFYGLLFIIPLSFSGYELLLNYLKKSKLLK